MHIFISIHNYYFNLPHINKLIQIMTNQLNQITEMFNKINLSFLQDYLEPTPQEQIEKYMNNLSIETTMDQSNGKVSKRGQNIMQEHKIISLETNVGKRKEILGQKDYYLNEYLKRLGINYNPFILKQIVHHHTTLKSIKSYSKDQTILQLPCQCLITDRQFENTNIFKYIIRIKNLINSHIDIKKDQCPLSESEIINAIKKLLNLRAILYIFEMNYIVDICNIAPPQHPYQHFQWLYFHMLPKEFNYLPMYFSSTIKGYHESIASVVEVYENDSFKQYFILRQMINGDFFKPEYSFESFLLKEYCLNSNYFQHYRNLFNFSNYIWSKNCKETRIYINNQPIQSEVSNHDLTNLSDIPRMYIPIIDLLHHSYKNFNVYWERDIISGRVRLNAFRDIPQGQLLYIHFNKQPIQGQFAFFGFIDVDSECYLDLPLELNPKFLCKILQDIFQFTCTPNIKEWIAECLYEKEFKYIILRIQSYSLYSNFKQFMDEITRQCLKEALDKAKILLKELNKEKYILLQQKIRISLEAKKRCNVRFEKLKEFTHQFMKKQIIEVLRYKYMHYEEVKNKIIKSKLQQNISDIYHIFMGLHSILYSEITIIEDILKDYYLMSAREIKYRTKL